MCSNNSSKFLTEIAEKWTSNPDDLVRKVGKILEENLEVGADLPVPPGTDAVDSSCGLVNLADLAACGSSSSDDGEGAPATTGSWPLLEASCPPLSWRAHIPCPPSTDMMSQGDSSRDRILVADLAKTPSIHAGLLYLPPATCLPQHGEDACYVMEILYAGDKREAGKVGHIKEAVKAVEVGEVRGFQSGAPKVIQSSPASPLLLFFARTGLLEGGKFWFCDRDGQSAREFNDVMAIDNIHTYYIKMADNYESAMKAWGYCLPGITADSLLEQAASMLANPPAETRILDLGCGDGLTGEAFFKRGFTNQVGVDFSETMLKKAEERGWYKSLKRVDLLEALPFGDGEFDLLVSTGVTTYLKPCVLEDWIRLCCPGGLVVFSHKTRLWPEWEAEQNRLEEEKKAWTKVWESKPVPYLPSLKEMGDKTCQDDAKIYIYRKNC